MTSIVRKKLTVPRAPGCPVFFFHGEIDNFVHLLMVFNGMVRSNTYVPFVTKIMLMDAGVTSALCIVSRAARYYILYYILICLLCGGLKPKTV